MPILDLDDLATREPNYIGYVVKANAMYVYMAASEMTNTIPSLIEYTEQSKAGEELRYALGNMTPVDKIEGWQAETSIDIPSRLNRNYETSRAMRIRKRLDSEGEDRHFQNVMKLRQRTVLEKTSLFDFEFEKFDENDHKEWCSELDSELDTDNEYWDEKDPVYRHYIGYVQLRHHEILHPPSLALRRVGKDAILLKRRMTC